MRVQDNGLICICFPESRNSLYKIVDNWMLFRNLHSTIPSGFLLSLRGLNKLQRT